MGLGAGTIELYRQLKITGALDGVRNVMELGSQDYWCPHDNLMRALFQAFDVDENPADVFGATAQNQKPARRLYEAVGIKYHCVDVDGRDGTVIMDLNFDSVPLEQRGRYDFVTNHGTTEHLMNQSNAFQVMHDFARPGALMLHAVPFMGYVDHGFFSYHPNLFQALARYNSYEIVGLWIGPSMFVPQYIPWDISILDALALNPRTATLIVAALRKLHDTPFCCPFQGVYEDMAPDKVLTRYSISVDAELMDANRVRRLVRSGEVKEAWQSSQTAAIEVATETPHGQILPSVQTERRALRDTPGSELLKELAFRISRKFGHAN